MRLLLARARVGICELGCATPTINGVNFTYAPPSVRVILCARACLWYCVCVRLRACINNSSSSAIGPVVLTVLVRRRSVLTQVASPDETWIAPQQ